MQNMPKLVTDWGSGGAHYALWPAQISAITIKDCRLLFDETRYVDRPRYEFRCRRCPPEPGDVVLTREGPLGE
jgi:hypothetical protein